MPPRTKFDKEAIVEAAFDIAKEESFASITAHSVAKYLHCSVAPIFVHSQKNNQKSFRSKQCVCYRIGVKS